MNKKRIILISTILILFTSFSYIFKDALGNLYGYSKATLSYYGSRGTEVINIQDKLYKWGYYKGIVDGIYGYETYKAVKYFQAKNGLKADGIVGPDTLRALALPTGQRTSSSGSSYSYRNNVSLLAHIIHGEARGEPYKGQVAVGAVILNRVKSSKFPKTIAGVIYQPGAFDAVSDGQINLNPNKNAYNAARDALNGWDPTNGCLYYWNPSTATSNWIWSRPIVTQIGKHVFAR